MRESRLGDDLKMRLTFVLVLGAHESGREHNSEIGDCHLVHIAFVRNIRQKTVQKTEVKERRKKRGERE